ncbi:Crp/Fnr family transcriptional regulator [Pseudochelatococcus contaminans]|uniref:CRP-like cAMP-binding protein n=1 Tax=Pseudochelatococcus contaminans TaxID=1538103 RepID=A0A7W6EG63_9HYPH|nr:Crp/Fnr family transcriptional regulator [Pseudochelatococcus contaminans]MBB3809210.1 CRP-like cAMP-binding protein [Pseudochelatococcus contaminans]
MKIDIFMVRTLSLFSDVSDAELTRLMMHATARRVDRGDAVFEQGEDADTFYLLLNGRLKVTQLTPEGRQIMVRILHPGDIFGFARATTRRDYPVTARAAVESIVVGWSLTAWDAVVEATPRVAINAMRIVGERLDEAHTRLCEMSTQEVERRIAHTVLRIARKAGRKEADGICIDFPITRQDIAEMTGSTLHTVSRIMSAWEVQGIVGSGRQKLVVCNPAGLMQIAEGHP